MQLDMTPSGASPSFSPSPTAFGPSLITFTLHHPSPLLWKFKGVSLGRCHGSELKMALSMDTNIPDLLVVVLREAI